MVNIMENIVRERLDHLLNNFDCCKCDVCKDDMTALALNNLPSKYVTTSTGELLGRTETLNQAAMQALDIDIVMSINKVAKSPNHR
jgi:competence protein ComFB